MKSFIQLAILLSLLSACNTQKKVVKIFEPANEPSLVADDSKYTLQTNYPDFESWYLLQKKNSQTHSKSFYESENRKYVQAWNSNTVKSGNFDHITDYNMDTDYGINLNHKLYNYFKYCENVLKISILKESPNYYVSNGPLPKIFINISSE